MMRGSRSIVFVLSLLAVHASAGVGAAATSVAVADAAGAGDLRALRALVQQHANVNEPEPDGTTALHWAAHRGDLAAVEVLLGAGARQLTNHYGVTPLSLAAEQGSETVVARLLKAGANPNATLEGGETVLMTAARTGRGGVVKALVEAGANVNAQEVTRGQTALMWAAAEGHADVVRTLLAHGANISATSHAPSSPKDVTDGDSAYLRIAPRVDTCTALQFAVLSGQLEATRALLDAGANINDETPQGMGLITLAIANAHFDVAGLLVERGGDVNASKIGWTPLHQLVRLRTLNIGWGPPPPPTTGRVTALEIGQILLRHGADVDARQTKPWQDGYRGIFAMGATPFLLAAKGGDTQMMWLFATNGADVLATNANGTTALMAAAGVEMMNPNEDSGRDVDALAAVKLALQLGAGDVNSSNKGGETALHGAIARITPDAAVMLADSGAKLDAKNGRGVIPIEIALNGGGIAGQRPKTAEALRERMLAQGLTPPEARTGKDQYKFGVKEAK